LDADSAGVLRRLALDHNIGGLLDPIRELYLGQPVGDALGVWHYIYDSPFYDLLAIDHAERKISSSGVYAYDHYFVLH
jgi:hypothetical protein